MASKDKALEVIASGIIVARRFILLIFTPYKTMRTISMEHDYMQVGIIFWLVFCYFQIAGTTKQQLLPFILPPVAFLVNFSLTVLFFYLVVKTIHKEFQVRSFIFLFAYTLLPTLIWFTTNVIFFKLLPPPRTHSLLGTAFSIFFISFSVSLLLWKLLLFYLAIRFASRMKFFSILYTMILYTALFIPYSLLLYYLRLFRIPFM